MTTGDVVYSLRFSLIKILPEPGFDLGSTAGESCVLTARLQSNLFRNRLESSENIIIRGIYLSQFLLQSGIWVWWRDILSP